MGVRRSVGQMTMHFGVLMGSFCLLTGCGDSGGSSTPKPVYSSPEEIGTKNQELKDAMKGGAYGSAGRKSAGLINGAQ